MRTRTLHFPGMQTTAVSFSFLFTLICISKRVKMGKQRKSICKQLKKMSAFQLLILYWTLRLVKEFVTGS